MRAEVDWAGGVAFRATSGSGHTVTLDGPPDHGGENRGMRPMETVLVGCAGCSAFDVVHILGKAKVELERCKVEISGERAATEPKVFTAIHLKFALAGKGLTEANANRAVSLSVEKYCSALRMLQPTVAITHELSIG